MTMTQGHKGRHEEERGQSEGPGMGWGSLPVKCHQLGPQLRTLISKTTVVRGLAFLVFGKEGGARVEQV